MNKPQDFEIVGDHAEYRPAGQVSLAHGVELVTSAIVFAHEQRIRKLLVVTSVLAGFQPPNIVDRY